jgi:hypothetical protein
MAAALLIGSGLATPYVLDYDLMVLAPAIALLAARGLAQGFVAWELSLLATLWGWPLAARPLAEHTAIALTPIVPAMALVFIFASRQPTMPSAVATSATMATAYAQARSMLCTRIARARHNACRSQRPVPRASLAVGRAILGSGRLLIG